ncbi:STAS domain-containing protein [Nonomuraea sp. NPDC049480]|uniref:STAS domain-containing protein n=1 Tax=Nonomuraea sp. NPDC049480 TaxID=3364353 RepID=UPI003791829A
MTSDDSASHGKADPSAPTIVHLSGEIDTFTGKAVRRQLMKALRHSRNGVLVVDLSQVTFCDAGGLAVLVGIQRRARTRGVTLALASPRPQMSRLLHITGLDRGLPLLL